MANQLAHEWNATIFYEVEKNTKDAITIARKVTKNLRSANPQILSLEDAEANVEALSGLTCTLLDILADQGVTPEMVARLMGKMAGGRDHAIHRLLPLVKKEIKAELKKCKSLTLPRLDQKRADIAAGKRHPKAKGKGKGPKSSREDDTTVDHAEDEVQGGGDNGKRVVGAANASERQEYMALMLSGIFPIKGSEEAGALAEQGRSNNDSLEAKGETTMGFRMAATYGLSEEIHLSESLEERNCTEKLSETSESKKRKRIVDTCEVFKANDRNKENESILG